MPVEFSSQAALDQALDSAIDGILGDYAKASASMAQSGAREDTGFYKEHIIAMPPGSGNVAPSLDVRVDSRGTTRSYYAPGVDAPGEHEALIVAQASYSIWIELLDNTVFRAASAAVAMVPSIAAKYRF
jgi:hypothetical protein